MLTTLWIIGGRPWCICMNLGAALAEEARREALYNKVIAAGGCFGVAPALIKALGLHRGQQGIYRDLPRTAHLGPAGVALGVRHTGATYADDFSSDGIIYHYPATTRGRRDDFEIASLKAAAELGLSVFVIATPKERASARDIYRGWIVDCDDAAKWALISFDKPPARAAGEPVEAGFELTTTRRRRAVSAIARPGQSRFRYCVIKRYGCQCAACGVAASELLQAAHLCPSKRAAATTRGTGSFFA